MIPQEYIFPSLMLFGIGVFCFLVFGNLFKAYQIVKRGEKVLGKIVNEEIFVIRFNFIHKPIVEFIDKEGNHHRVTTRFGKQVSAREMLEDVEIAYLPHSPEKTAVLVGFRFYRDLIFGAILWVLIVISFPSIYVWALLQK